jgi:hypothetical protein
MCNRTKAERICGMKEIALIYRIIVDECFSGLPNGQGRVGGLTNSYLLSGMMDRLGIRAPARLDNRKVRFYFTEKGWRQAGRLIAVEGREKGHAVRVIRRKEPNESQVVFRDELQIALLPSRRAKRY